MVWVSLTGKGAHMTGSKKVDFERSILPLLPPAVNFLFTERNLHCSNLFNTPHEKRKLFKKIQICMHIYTLIYIYIVHCTNCSNKHSCPQVFIYHFTYLHFCKYHIVLQLLLIHLWLVAICISVPLSVTCAMTIKFNRIISNKGWVGHNFLLLKIQMALQKSSFSTINSIQFNSVLFI